MIEQYYAVIMAGGGGTRLWPLSRRARPKQMLQLFGDRTLFQIAVDRLEGLFPPERILVVTVEEQSEGLQSQCPDIPVENFLLEPMPRGTASVVGLAAVVLSARDPKATMAILTADHFIRDEALFRRLLRSAMEASLDDYLVTLGITPTYPATGYGYINMGERLGNYGEMVVFEVKRFVEKPDLDRAEEMVKADDHAWNSGMFVWRCERILDEFERQMPELSRGLKQISRSIGTPEEEGQIQEVWRNLESQTIDYGIMEGAKKVAVIPAEGLGWSDVGSWDSLYDLLPTNEDGNIVMKGDHLNIQSHENLIYVEREDRLVVTIGVQDLVVVDTGDVLLICDKIQAQKVRNAVRRIEETEKEVYL
jgi:mannose-1-phosphate guanylyltransferase